MKISVENNMLHVVFDDLLPHRLRDDSTKNMVRQNSKIRSDIHSRLKSAFTEVDVSSLIEAHWKRGTIIFCHYIHEDKKANGDSDNIDINFVTNDIVKRTGILIDDGPSLLSTMSASITDWTEAEGIDKWLKDNEDPSMKEISHSEAFLLESKRIAINARDL